MPMDYINVILAALALVNGWVLVAVQSGKRTVESLKAADTSMGEKIAAIQVLLAGSYLTRSEFVTAMDKQTESIVKAIEKLDAKVERKQDRVEK